MYLTKTCVLFFLVSTLVVAPAQAQSSDDDWQHSLKIYVWASAIDGTTAAGSSVNVEFDQIIDSLKLAMMAGYEGRKGRWGVLIDGLYMNLGDDKSLQLPNPFPPPPGLTLVSVGLDLQGLVITAAGTYSLGSPDSTAAMAVLGARYLDLSSELRVTPGLTGLFPPVAVPLSGDSLDAVVGIKGQVDFSDRWHFNYYADVGAGDSDFTYQLIAGVGFSAWKQTDLKLVYRDIGWDIKSDRVRDLRFSGPLLGVVFRF